MTDTGVFGPGGTIAVTFEDGGIYALFCFISDRAGSPPHAISHDMYKVVTIGG